MKIEDFDASDDVYLCSPTKYLTNASKVTRYIRKLSEALDVR
jgi:hypothetical protein